MRTPMAKTHRRTMHVIPHAVSGEASMAYKIMQKTKAKRAKKTNAKGP